MRIIDLLGFLVKIPCKIQVRGVGWQAEKLDISALCDKLLNSLAFLAPGIVKRYAYCLPGVL
jgi:hypothetical protein